MRNDQLLTRRQGARPLVAIGLQDRGGRNVVAARQYFERVAGADDDRGAALAGPRAPPPSAAQHCRWPRSDGRAEHRRPGRALLRTRHRRSDKTAARRSAAAGPATDTALICGREYCGSSRRSTVGVGTEPVASGREAKGLEKEFCERRVDMSALQPAKPIDISASTATCGTRREQSNSTTRDMVTHSYATKYCFE